MRPNRSWQQILHNSLLFSWRFSMLRIFILYMCPHTIYIPLLGVVVQRTGGSKLNSVPFCSEAVMHFFFFCEHSEGFVPVGGVNCSTFTIQTPSHMSVFVLLCVASNCLTWVHPMYRVVQVQRSGEDTVGVDKTHLDRGLAFTFGSFWSSKILPLRVGT